MKPLILIILYFIVNVNAVQYTRTGIKILEAYISETLDSTDNETECGKQLKLFVADIRGAKMWALQMLDSSAKVQPGLLTGNLVQIGNYDECLEIDETRNGSQIQGQYCRSTLTPTQTVNECINQHLRDREITGLGDTSLAELQDFLKMYWDVCIPAACSTADVQKIWNFAEVRYELKVHLLFRDDLCTTVEKINYYSLLNIAAMIVFAVIGFIVVLSTLYDVFVFQKRKNKDKEYDLFMAFSYYTNGKRLFSIKEADDTKITCLHGIRVISIAWIILGHRYLINFLGTSINFTYLAEWLTHKENMFIVGAFACVDSFFVMSGFLIIYLVLLAKENGIKMNLIVFYVHRILRLTPSLAAIILVYVGILPHLGSGPYWNYIDNILIQPCVDHWWSTLTFVQNYLHPMTACIIQTWYLSVDTHLYVLSPFLFLPLQRWPKPTIAFTVGLILVSVGLTVHATYYYKIDSISMRVGIQYYEHIYNPTHIRMGPWLLGCLLGYFMFESRNKKFEIKQKYVYLLWVACISAMLCILHGCIIFLSTQFSILTAAIFNGISRIVWGACICWVIFACSHGYGGYINKFLSLSFFNILGRLTFSAYLTHGLVVGIVQGQRGTTGYLYNLFHFYEVWGDFAFTIGLSVIWTLTFESPVSILESVVIKRAFKENMKSKEVYISKRV